MPSDLPATNPDIIPDCDGELEQRMPTSVREHDPEKVPTLTLASDICDKLLHTVPEGFLPIQNNWTAHCSSDRGSPSLRGCKWPNML